MERTHTTPRDEALRRLAQPTYAAQILTVAAWALELDSAADLTAAGLADALDTATAGIVGHLPAAVAETASITARAQLTPYAGITRGEYALRLRAAAAKDRPPVRNRCPQCRFPFEECTCTGARQRTLAVTR